MRRLAFGRMASALAVPIGLVGIIMLLVVPIPAWLLDLLITVNILFALVILLTTMFAKRPLDFSVFPSLLLIATLFRLGLNVASTRLVLGQGYAGEVIHAFGAVAVGGSMVIGAVVFVILVVIQFVVVTKGAERVAEVGARFTLDAMPGKQMAIDADLNSGLITEDEARRRRKEVSAEADFYGAMDGASKFVKGDAIAGIVIVLVNVLGGIIMGVVIHGQQIGDAVNTYTLLTIGDGLTAQIPALLMAVSTGMIVTRVELGDLARPGRGQAAHAVAPRADDRGRRRLPHGAHPRHADDPVPPRRRHPDLRRPPASAVRSSSRSRTRRSPRSPRSSRAPPADSPEELMEQMRVHALEVQLSPDLVDLVSGVSDDLLARVKALRRRIAMEYGVVVPPVRTRDSVDLPPSTYVIRVAGVEMGRGIAPGRQGARARRPPRRAAGHPDDRAGVPARRQVDPGRAAARGRDDRRDGDRPRLRARHAPLERHHRQRRPPPVPRGRAGADGGRQARAAPPSWRS